MKKILIISPYLPFPLNSGGAVAQYYFLKPLQNIFDVTFITIINNEEEAVQTAELEANLKNINFIFFKNYTETEYKPNFILRCKTFLAKFLRIRRVSNHIKKENPVLYIFTSQLFKSFIKNYVRSHSFDFIQCEFFETLDIIDYLPESTAKIFVHHEIRFKAVEKQLEKNISKERLDDLKKLELSYLSKFNKIVVFNSNDKKLLHESLEHKFIHISPFAIPSCPLLQKENTFNKFLFIGNQAHYSNFEAVFWFIESVYIPNYAVIDWELHIVGKWREDFIKSYSSYSKIIFHGYVKHLQDITSNTVLINPILSGSGIRTKVLEAFVNGIPVLTTSLGAEGLFHEGVDKHLLIFESATDFMNLFVSSCNDKTLIQVAENGILYYKLYFNDKLLLQKRLAIYE